MESYKFTISVTVNKKEGGIAHFTFVTRNISFRHAQAKASEFVENLFDHQYEKATYSLLRVEG